MDMCCRYLLIFSFDIVGRCGALVILGPVVRGTDVELGYFPSDLSIKRRIDNGRRAWKKNDHPIHLGGDSYKERTVSEYLYILTIFNLDETDEGTYMLSCNAYSNTDSVQLHIEDMPSVLSMSVKKIHEYNNNVCVWFLNISCETNISNPPCTIEWSSDNDNLRYKQSNNWTYGKSHSYHSVSNVLYNVNTYMTGGTITCSTICDHFPFNLNTDYTVSSSDFSPEQFMKAEIVKESNHNVLNLTCKTVDTCMPCTIAWSSNSVFLSSISTAQWTNASNLGYTTVSNALYLITKGLDGKRIHCSTYCGNASSHSEQETYIISLEDFQESTTNLASVVIQQWHLSILYSVAGSILVVLVTMCAVLLFRRCKPQVYETVLLRRRSAGEEGPRHMYDGVQHNVETNALYNLTEVSTRAIDSEHTPPPRLNMDERNVRLNRTVRQYDYVDNPVDHRDRHKRAPTANQV
ncbi:uncharacterized protein LOC128244590 isoform X2 [Mya arenaria]|uniref:uncharacterized protein LOC128244590 isoform X2 n=1 Tax=Mya arenaria TaxID=6604 RepID=UPI0022DF5F68|nr:uncharacterized protein LOC128244590 isoform X2 [Mya arenaria]